MTYYRNKPNNSGTSLSVWMNVPLPAFPALEEDMESDVCIIGSGIVGLTCAYTLAKKGKSVIVIDQGVIGGGQTARTTAHLTWVLDDHYYLLEELFGKENSRLAAESHAASIDYIEKIISEENIECDFERVDGYLFTPPEGPNILYKELESIKKLGMSVEEITKAPFSKTFDTGPCLRFPHQAQFHIIKYLHGLLRAIVKYGGKIFANTHANHIQDGAPCTITTAYGSKVLAQSAIVATCTPVNDRFIIHTKQEPYRTYVIAAAVPQNSVPKGLYWDTADPYHYIRTQKHLSDPQYDWLIIGGEDHKTGQDPDIEGKYQRLEEWAKERFPFIEEISYRWSGQVFEPIDFLAFIGKNPKEENVYIATGDSGNGMTHGTIAGMLIPDLILGNDNPWKDLYDPARKTWKKISEFLSAQINVAMQYVDWLTPGEKSQIDSLAPDEGIVLREGLKKIAAYKDKEGELHMTSACCPHLGGCVHWNPGEKSWDCPCHGSRFDHQGTVITGPAIHNLDS